MPSQRTLLLLLLVLLPWCIAYAHAAASEAANGAADGTDGAPHRRGHDDAHEEEEEGEEADGGAEHADPQSDGVNEGALSSTASRAPQTLGSTTSTTTTTTAVVTSEAPDDDADDDDENEADDDEAATPASSASNSTTSNSTDTGGGDDAQDDDDLYDATPLEQEMLDEQEEQSPNDSLPLEQMVRLFFIGDFLAVLPDHESRVAFVAAITDTLITGSEAVVEADIDSIVLQAGSIVANVHMTSQTAAAIVRERVQGGRLSVSFNNQDMLASLVGKHPPSSGPSQAVKAITAATVTAALAVLLALVLVVLRRHRRGHSSLDPENQVLHNPVYDLPFFDRKQGTPLTAMSEKERVLQAVLREDLEIINALMRDSHYLHTIAAPVSSATFSTPSSGLTSSPGSQPTDASPPAAAAAAADSSEQHFTPESLHEFTHGIAEATHYLSSTPSEHESTSADSPSTSHDGQPTGAFLPPATAALTAQTLGGALATPVPFAAPVSRGAVGVPASGAFPAPAAGTFAAPASSAFPALRAAAPPVQPAWDVQSDADVADLPLIHWAVEFDRPLSLQCLISHRIDINERDAQGRTPLMLACLHAPDLVGLLLAKGADPNLRDKDGSSSLILAARHCDARSVKTLLKARADASLTDARGMTALMHSAINNMPDVTDLIAHKRNAMINAQDINGWTALHWAVAVGAMDTVQRLLRYKKLEICAVNHAGESPLHLAARNARIDLARALISGADAGKSVSLLALETVVGQTAADYALAANCFALAQLLTQARQDAGHRWVGDNEETTTSFEERLQQAAASRKRRGFHDASEQPPSKRTKSAVVKVQRMEDHVLELVRSNNELNQNLEALRAQAERLRAKLQ